MLLLTMCQNITHNTAKSDIQEEQQIISMVLNLKHRDKLGTKINDLIIKRSSAVWGILGVIFLVLGISLGWIILPKALNKFVPEKVNLASGEDTRRNWLKMPVFDFNIYLFNVTNYEAVKQGAKPILQEIGPYCYRELKEKVDLREDSERDIISYRTRNTWLPNQKGASCEASDLTGAEMLVVPNVPLLSILLVAEKDFPAPFLAAVNVALPSIFGDNSDLFLVASAHTLLFGGILIDCLRRGLLTTSVCSALRERSSGLKKIGEDRYLFSFLGRKNGSVEKTLYTVRRGASAADDVGRLVDVDGRPRLSYWKGDCNILQGTDGSIFPPFREPDNHSLVAYSGEVCRVVHGVYEGQHVSKGVKGYRYSITLGDTDSDIRDKCFCAADDRCYKKGTLDAFKCQGAPLVASLPHFYAASEDYMRGVDGLHPDKENHSILVVLEPTSGSPLVAKKRIQMNIDLKPIRFTPNTQGLRRNLVPLFWAEELFELDGELLELLQASLLRPMKIIHAGCLLMITLGAIFFIFAFIIYVKQLLNSRTLDQGKHFDYGPEFKEKLKYLAPDETIVQGPFFIDATQSLTQPQWGKPRAIAEINMGPGIVRTETTLVGATKTVKYKRISGLKEIMVKEKIIDS